MRRTSMIEKQLKARGISDEVVLRAMEKVPRHEFIPEEGRARAYQDGALPIGYRQTISQPYIVAFMSEALEVFPKAKILEIGSGSGYQAAVLAEMGASVFTIEIVPELTEMADIHLKKTGYADVQVKQGNGYLGWPEEAPFDRIILTAAPEKVPPVLVEQLAEDGIMVLPVGPMDEVQSLQKIRKTKKGIETKTILPVRFVPMIDDQRQDQ